MKDTVQTVGFKSMRQLCESILLLIKCIFITNYIISITMSQKLHAEFHICLYF